MSKEISSRKRYAAGKVSTSGGETEFWENQYDALREEQKELAKKLGIWGPRYMDKIPSLIENEKDEDRLKSLKRVQGIQQNISKGIDSYFR